MQGRILFPKTGNSLYNLYIPDDGLRDKMQLCIVCLKCSKRGNNYLYWLSSGLHRCVVAIPVRSQEGTVLEKKETK